MINLQNKLHEIYSLEELSSGTVGLRRLHTMPKIIVTIVYIICVASFGTADISGIAVFAFYPIVGIVISEIPLGIFAKRLLQVLPFCVLAAMSNLLFSGMESFFAVIAKAVLSVSALVILIAVTPFVKLTLQLRRMHVPEVFVNLLEMTYRYISCIGDEASTMSVAYSLRSSGRHKKGVNMKDMGSFVGQLLIRSLSRAERVYSAMKCRGYGVRYKNSIREKQDFLDYAFLIIMVFLSILFRFVNLSQIIGGLF